MKNNRTSTLCKHRMIIIGCLVALAIITGFLAVNMIPKATAADYPEWNAGTAYSAGDIVMHNGATWQAKWYNVNEEPADVSGNAWNMIAPPPPQPTELPENPYGYDTANVFFDDFNIYNTSSDQALLDFGYEVSDRTGGPGPGGCTWSKNNVTFVTDPALTGNKFLRLTATTNGQGENTVQAEIMAPRQFLYGTYGARVKFTDTPAYGPDGDQIVETFYTISPWTLQGSPDYGEMDFEYLANGGWGIPGNTMWNTTWETASTRISNSTRKSFEGWHICVIQCTSTEVKYYIDGQLLATHGGIYVPETPMFLSFNLWFIDGVWAGGSEQRAYIEDIDWVYYSKDRIMPPSQVECNVNYYRNHSLSRKDTIGNPPVSSPTPTPAGNPTPTPTATPAPTATPTPTRTALPTPTPGGSSTNVALGKSGTSSEGTLGAVVTDGNKNTNNFFGLDQGIKWIQIDLGQSYNINKINLWHYFGDGRTYRDVVIRVSNNSGFSSGVTTVFNNDTNNSLGFGAGSDAEYAESSAGKSITFNSVNARYVRLYSNGSSSNAYNHYVEVEVWTSGGTAPTPTPTRAVTATPTRAATPTPTRTASPTPTPGGSSTNVALGKSGTSSVGALGAVVTDGNKNTNNFFGLDLGVQWIQIDLGQSYNINKINLWHYFGDGRTYRDVVIRVSNNSGFSSGVTTVFNNDTNNSLGFGAGSDAEYAESSAGKSITFNSVNARYVRLYSNGSSSNEYNHYVEVEVWTGSGGAATPTPTRPGTPTPTGVPGGKRMFDDFNYTGSGDSNLSGHGWSVRTGSGGPGPGGCSWSAGNVTFPTESGSNKMMRLSATTGGSGGNTVQSEVYTSQRKYFAGTYAARVRFYDTPTSGSDGAAINETFFAISPLDYNNDPNYSELDFEYLANGGWGVSGPTMWMSSWYTYTPDPWSKDNVYNYVNSSHAGWRTLVITVGGGEVKYYIDGVLRATHNGKYYPRKNMTINFNLWFLAEGPLTPSTYIQDVDWVFHAKDVILTPAQVESQVQSYRSQSITFIDEVN